MGAPANYVTPTKLAETAKEIAAGNAGGAMAANKSVLSAATTSHELTFISHELTTYFTLTHSLTHPPTHPPAHYFSKHYFFLYLL